MRRTKSGRLEAEVNRDAAAHGKRLRGAKMDTGESRPKVKANTSPGNSYGAKL